MEQKLETMTLDAQLKAQSTQELLRLSMIHQAPKKQRFPRDKDVLLIDDKPTTNKETMLDINSNKWFNTMKSKMNFI